MIRKHGTYWYGDAKAILMVELLRYAGLNARCAWALCQTFEANVLETLRRVMLGPMLIADVA